MAGGKAEVSIDRSPDEVWKLVREFGGLETWMPGVETCVVEGDVRTIGMMGISVKEKLRGIDDNARTISYSVVESPMGNLESHLATIAVEPEGSGSHVTWSVEVSPDDLLGLFVPIYEGSVVELKKKIES
ncbi:MAG TPA: SRPBCC family protein [Acidimicrobiia bacterium]|jgi:carbon monoxide dehydrogenase subunit G|nr:SRPBCC family protein [Acidimicrobiia bacterium]